MSAIDRIIEFAHASHELPPAVRGDAMRLLADTLAVGATGAASREAAPVLRAAGAWGTGTEARTLAGGTLPAPSAAFVNAFAIHCLEWDAVHEPAVVHALSVVTAALLAASDRRGGSTVDEFLTALAVGVDIASGLGLAAQGAMRFFRPATAGIIGAALAVARLQGLDRAQMANAAGLAYSFLAGTMQAHVEASTALPLQIANAARGALCAVDLAAAGIDGPHDVLTGPFGYAALIEPVELERYTASLGAVWRISEVSIKPYPSGRASHGALGALADLRDEGLVTPDNVEAIELLAPPLIQRLVGRPFRPGAPQSYNRLCLAFLAPLMLRDGLIDPRLDTTIDELAGKVRVTLDDNPDHNALSPQVLVVHLRNGQALRRAVAANPGSPQAPLSPARAQTKLDLCRTLAGAAAARIFTDPLAFATEPK
ncbi:MAG TPA: MmgE/PrpD family protein [Novosphingobium sp.]|nr:MmgE/PrpD family protein [Novosphingobium sp.]HQA17036.1 MmgE/PrpD family protein [Novosphingobium sp.]